MKFLAFAVLAFPMIASAGGMKTPYEVCSRFTTVAGDSQCRAVIQSTTYFDMRALYECDRYTTEAGTISCLHAVGNKAFTAPAIEGCGAWQNEAPTTSCFEQEGVSIYHLSPSEYAYLLTRPYAYTRSVID